MRILVISDSHGNVSNLIHVMGFAKKIKAEAVIHCGDWDNVKAVNTVISVNLPLYSVLGNADIDPEVGKLLKMKSKRFEQIFLEIVIDGKKIGIIHDLKLLSTFNHGFNIKNLDIIFFGHWQKQKDITWKGTRTVNSGALENDINFAIYDTKTDEVKFIHE